MFMVLFMVSLKKMFVLVWVIWIINISIIDIGFILFVRVIFIDNNLFD